ncbi:MAG: carbohydrate ABC transporter permease, partial [Treponema sp.]|nr:carbohydrate ABC transporter permease [Treponema sp.]
SNYILAFVQNFIVSGGAILLTLIVGVPAAYAFARYDFKNKEGWAFQILSFKFAPEILVILPVFMIFQRIGLYDTYFGLIWVYQLITMPLLIWVVRGYFEDINIEIEQAAQLDGYAWYAVFFKILLPLIKPGLVAASLLAFIFAWNSFTFPLILSGVRVQTITITSLRFLASDTVHYGQVAVAAVIAVLPEIIICLFIQKHLVRGLSFGAVKG